MIKRLSNNKRIRVLLAIVLLLTISLSFVGVSYAAQQFSASKDDLRNNSVVGGAILENNGGNPPNLSGYETKKDNPSLGYDAIYGTSDRSTYYRGEVPNIDAYKDKPKFNSDAIDSTTRTWYNSPKKISEKLSWDSNKTNDIHAMSLVDKNANIMSGLINILSGLIYGIFALLNVIFSAFVKLFISIGNFDVSFLTKLDPIGITKNVTEVLIGDGNTFSPILILATVVFMIGLIGVIAKNVTSGTESGRKIVQEALIMVLAFIMVGVSINGGWDRILVATTQFSSKAITSINKDLGEKVKLFTYDTGNPGEDSNNTMNGLVSKTFIDSVISQQFGVNVNELDLYGTNVDTQKLWGIDAATMKDIVSKVSSKDDIATVSVGNENNSSSPNLGYMWYAMNTGVDTTDPIYVKDGRIYPNVVSKDRVLYIIDILSAIDAEAGGSPKAQAIIQRFKSPSVDPLNMILITLITAGMAYALALVSIISLASKLIFNAGFFFVPFFPIMLLIPKLRDTVKKSLNTWINSAVKMVLSQAMMIIIIFVASSLCSYANAQSYIVCFIILLAFGKYAPVIITKANDAISANRDQLQLSRQLDSRLSSMANSYSRGSVADNISAAKERKKQMRERMNNVDQQQKPHDYTGDTSFTDGGASGSGFSNFGDGAINYTEEDKAALSNIADNLASRNKEIDNMSLTDIAKNLGVGDSVDINSLGDIEEKLNNFEEISNSKSDISSQNRQKIESILTSKTASVLSATRFGNMIVGASWNKVQSHYNKKAERGGLNSIESIKYNSTKDKQAKLLNTKVNIGGKEMTLREAINNSRDKMKKEAAKSANNSAANISANRVKIMKEKKEKEDIVNAYNKGRAIRVGMKGNSKSVEEAIKVVKKQEKKKFGKSSPNKSEGISSKRQDMKKNNGDK